MDDLGESGDLERRIGYGQLFKSSETGMCWKPSERERERRGAGVG